MLSVPAILIYMSGSTFENPIAKTTLGNLGNYQRVACQDTDLSIYQGGLTRFPFKFQCEPGFELVEFRKYGLATANQICNGQDLSVDVDTTEKCSSGASPASFSKFEALFTKTCVGKPYCLMSMDSTDLLSSECRSDLADRQSGASQEPAKMFTVAIC